ncbi:MAG: dihydrofolate synthase/folylpolyglutamate synthase [Planctomycetota bacterium]|jgi:dihydrofolate synthase/folylpolyglutamate synthase
MLKGQLERLERLINWEQRSRGATATGTQASGMRVTVEPASDLLARLGHPENKFRVVHVAGTKGKGSVASLVAGGLEAAGIRTGVFASPHVERVNERIRIGGAQIDDDELALVLKLALDAQVAATREETAAITASWFDILTAAGMLAFGRQNVIWAVVECGLGGRLDSTNALSGEVCVVTNIDLEHTDVLGTTRAEIAAEKVGIVDRGATLVTRVERGSEAGAVIEARARELGVTVLRPDVESETIEDENLALAEEVLGELKRRGVCDSKGEPLSTKISQEVQLSALLPGRLEVREFKGVRVLLDGAHVPSSLERVLCDFERMGLLSGGPVVAVLGVGQDKQLDGLLKVLHKTVDRLVCTSVGSGPVRSPGQILEAATELFPSAEKADGPRVALNRAIDLATPTGVVLVTGSLHLIGALRPFLSPTNRC